MATETQIRTRHEAVGSSSSTEFIGEKNSQAHKDRGLLLKILRENYFTEQKLSKDLREGMAESERSSPRT